MKRLLFALSASAVLSLQAAKTDPVGVVTTEIPAHDGGDATFKIISLSLLNPIEYSGIVESVATDTVTLSTSDMVAGEFNSADNFGNPHYYIEIRSGSLEGLTVPIQSNSNSSITLIEDVSVGIHVGDVVVVRRYSTVGSIFGPDNTEYNLFSSSTSASADILYLPQADGSFQVVFYQNAPAFAGGTGWRSTADIATDQSGSVILNEAFVIGRFGDDSRPSITFSNFGDVKVVAQRNPIHPGSNTLTYAYPVSKKLNELGFDPTDLETSGNVDLADNLWVVSNSSFERYFYQSAPAFAGGNGWRSTSDISTDQGPLVEINPGDGLIFIRRGSTPFNWISTPPSGLQ